MGAIGALAERRMLVSVQKSLQHHIHLPKHSDSGNAFISRTTRYVSVRIRRRPYKRQILIYTIWKSQHVPGHTDTHLHYPDLYED